MDADLTNFFSSALQYIANAKTAGALITLALLVKLFVDLSKSTLGQRLLGKLLPSKKPWIRTVVSLALAFLGAAAGAVALGAGWLGAVGSGLAGLVTVWTATGMHETVSALQPSERDRVQARQLFEQALAGADEEAKAKVAALKAVLDAAVQKPTKQERLAAIAAFMRGNPPVHS